MSAFRYSGRVRIRVTYREAMHGNGSYRCTLRAFGSDTLSFVSSGGYKGKPVARETIIVGAPAILPRGEGVDSPEAFDSAARAAIAFADSRADALREDGKDSFRWSEAAAIAPEDDPHAYHVGRAPLQAFPPRVDGRKVSILSIDAWNGPDGWTWNTWHKIGTCDVSIASLAPRPLLAWMRANGFLSEASRGRVRIEDDQYNVVFCDKGTGEPLFAIAYGEADSEASPDASTSPASETAVNAPEVHS